MDKLDETTNNVILIRELIELQKDYIKFLSLDRDELEVQSSTIVNTGLRDKKYEKEKEFRNEIEKLYNLLNL